jgi:NAD(P)-dependent dehydrogenase (short-subunit alcohol dehydrogenase family)
MKSLFAGKVALITGGTSGIGRATAVAFAEQGANVVVAGRREAQGAESVALVEKAGGNGLFVRTDVISEEQIAGLVARTVEHFGQLDFAFNNAGVGGEAGSGVGIANTGEFFDRFMNTNVRSVFFGMKHQIPALLRSGGGAIVNNASIAALRPVADAPIYSASKLAVIGLTKSAALEFAAKRVRINAVCPAVIETDMTERLRHNDQIHSRVLAMHPIGRFGYGLRVAGCELRVASCGFGEWSSCQPTALAGGIIPPLRE